MLYMIIERFKDADPVPIYRRLRDEGRLIPDGVEYRGSWVTTDLASCYQVMECEDRALLDAWLAEWEGYGDFEVVPVITSAEAQAAVAPRL